MPFSFDAYGGTVSGTVQVRVVRSVVDNTLDFYWRVTNDAASAGPIADFRIGPFTDTFQNVNFRIDGLGDVDSISAYRFSGVFESYVNFSFGDALTSGSSTKFFFVDTEAPSYQRTAFYDLIPIGEAVASLTYPRYAPIPVPGALLLFGSGLMGLGAAVWRRKRNA
ncbi:MAG: PEP-CTERM sorting domain-containing protein [Nitrospira sp.]|nr:PEP-CTERM sorting domain-containing protein [Nitrospira sp.]